MRGCTAIVTMHEMPHGLDTGQQPVCRPYTHTCQMVSAGTGVNVYVLDTGIRQKHTEFQVPNSNTSRVIPGFDAVSTSGPGTTEDCHGHGSHVAAVIGGQLLTTCRQVNRPCSCCADTLLADIHSPFLVSSECLMISVM